MKSFTKATNPSFAAAWSPDDDVLVFVEIDPDTRSDIWIMTGDGEASPLLASEFGESYPGLSPDAQWLAYVSNESGRDEVYVQPFPISEKGWWCPRMGEASPCGRPTGASTSIVRRIA